MIGYTTGVNSMLGIGLKQIKAKQIMLAKTNLICCMTNKSKKYLSIKGKTCQGRKKNPFS